MSYPRKRPNFLHRQVINLHVLWLVGVIYTSFVTTEHAAGETLGLSTDAMSNTIAIPLLILFTFLVTLSSQWEPEGNWHLGFNFGMHLLFCMASVPFLLANAITMFDVTGSLVAEICVATAALSILLNGRKQQIPPKHQRSMY